MKKCVNCGYESSDEATSCPSCRTDAFTSTSPEALGHIVSPEEQRFWEQITFRQFAIFMIRLQAIWLFFYAVLDASYLVEFVFPYVRFTLHAEMMVVRVGMNMAAGIVCLCHADRIVSWLVKGIIPKLPSNSSEKRNI